MKRQIAIEAYRKQQKDSGKSTSGEVMQEKRALRKEVESQIDGFSKALGRLDWGEAADLYNQVNKAIKFLGKINSAPVKQLTKLLKQKRGDSFVESVKKQVRFEINNGEKVARILGNDAQLIKYALDNHLDLVLTVFADPKGVNARNPGIQYQLRSECFSALREQQQAAINKGDYAGASDINQRMQNIAGKESSLNDLAKHDNNQIKFYDAHKKYKTAVKENNLDVARGHHAKMKLVSQQAGFSELEDFIVHSEQELDWSGLLGEQRKLSKELKDIRKAPQQKNAEEQVLVEKQVSEKINKGFDNLGNIHKINESFQLRYQKQIDANQVELDKLNGKISNGKASGNDLAEAEKIKGKIKSLRDEKAASESAVNVLLDNQLIHCQQHGLCPSALDNLLANEDLSAKQKARVKKAKSLVTPDQDEARRLYQDVCTAGDVECDYQLNYHLKQSNQLQASFNDNYSIFSSWSSSGRKFLTDVETQARSNLADIRRTSKQAQESLNQAYKGLKDVYLNFDPNSEQYKGQSYDQALKDAKKNVKSAKQVWSRHRATNRTH